MGIRQRRIIVHFKYQYQAKLTQYRTFQISISVFAEEGFLHVLVCYWYLYIIDLYFYKILYKI
jgi:hypothetical protein